MEKNKLTDSQLQKLENGREYRSMTMEVRASEDDSKMIVEGYATTFNQQYLLYDSRYYKVFEQIDPHAFDACDMSDVIMQYDHEGRVMARTRNDTLQLSVDGTGLKVVANLSGTENGKRLYEEIKGGYIDRMSFGFVVGEDQRTTTEDHENDVETITRTITKITKLYDVSAVSIPANDTTSISARRYANGVIDGIKAERLERAKKKLKLKIKMEGN